MAQIDKDQDHRAVIMTREYIHMAFRSPEPRPPLVAKTELCGACNTLVSDAIGKVQDDVYGTLQGGKKELVVRRALEQQTHE
jgi:hypothetical protein